MSRCGSEVGDLPAFLSRSVMMSERRQASTLLVSSLFFPPALSPLWLTLPTKLTPVLTEKAFLSVSSASLK